MIPKLLLHPVCRLPRVEKPFSTRRAEIRQSPESRETCRDSAFPGAARRATRVCSSSSFGQVFFWSAFGLLLLARSGRLPRADSHSREGDDSPLMACLEGDERETRHPREGDERETPPFRLHYTMGLWRCLANWATVVCQNEERSTHWIRLYLYTLDFITLKPRVE